MWLVTACPTESGAAIVHGDYRIDNAILGEGDPSRVLAVVDWEMATLGDPLADLGLHLAYSDPAFDPVLGGLAEGIHARHIRGDTVGSGFDSVGPAVPELVAARVAAQRA